MKKDLWQVCLSCNEKCCGDFAFPLFLTPEERKKHPNLNTKCPCVFFGRGGGLCEIHNTRPFDCRLFPFDIMMKGIRFSWIIWEVNCPISRGKEDDFEKYLDDHEKNLIPRFIKHMANYAKFREEEMDNKFKYKILREVKIPISRKNI